MMLRFLGCNKVQLGQTRLFWFGPCLIEENNTRLGCNKVQLGQTQLFFGFGPCFRHSKIGPTGPVQIHVNIDLYINSCATLLKNTRIVFLVGIRVLICLITHEFTFL